MLIPKKLKHRKVHKGKISGKALRKNTVDFGEYGIMSLGAHFITSQQIEATRRVISRGLQKGGKIWIRIFPNKPVTKKPGEVSMGKGKGPLDHYVAVVKPGTVLFEIDGVSEEAAKNIFKLASYKLPIKTKFIKRLKI
jgi:large subunit ribosomal protein L16